MSTTRLPRDLTETIERRREELARRLIGTYFVQLEKPYATRLPGLNPEAWPEHLRSFVDEPDLSPPLTISGPSREFHLTARWGCPSGRSWSGSSMRSPTVYPTWPAR